ncbi:MAG: TonB family protein, partial [Gemmatimonadetes bacterium]|nr:TonB family protein [Gemmatimonadota bacterium]
VQTPQAPPSLPEIPVPDATPEPEVVPEPDPVEPEKAPEPEAAPEVVTPEEVVPDPVKKPTPPQPKRVFKKYAPKREDDQPSLAERLKQRLETASESAEAATPAAATPAERPDVSPEIPVADEVVAVPTGSSAEVQAVDFPYQWYLNVLRTKITAAWDPPGEHLLSGRAREVIVQFRVHRDGRITDVAVESASRTPGLDASARRAVERGGPYPPLPTNYENDWLDVAVRFTVEG